MFTSFQKKLYLGTLCKYNYWISKARLLRREGIMEEFDTNNELIGFENGIYDVESWFDREGRPEDYIVFQQRLFYRSMVLLIREKHRKDLGIDQFQTVILS